MESKPNLFRVGCFYRNGFGEVVRLDDLHGVAERAASRSVDAKPYDRWYAALHSLLDGRNSLYDFEPRYALIPGELVLKDGEWVPVEHPDELTEAEVADLFASARQGDPNAEMIARDGPAIPKPTPIPAAPVTAAKPALSGLTTVRGFSYLFGAGL